MKIKIYIACEMSRGRSRRIEKLKRMIKSKLPGIAERLIIGAAAAAAITFVICGLGLDAQDYEPYAKGVIGSLIVLGLCAAAYQVLEDI